MRRPSLQFYPGDWQSNPKLRRCSHAEKGIWLDVLCILHDQDEYGIVRWPLRELAAAVHTKMPALQSLIDKKVLKGAPAGEQCEALTYTPRTGGRDGETVILIPTQPGPIWYSSRMVRDEYIRLHRGASTRFGVPPTARHGTPQGNGSSSSLSFSSSTSTSLNPTHTPDTPRAEVCVCKSKFSLEQNLEYAWAAWRNGRGIKQPEAWAAKNVSTGELDSLVEQYFADPSQFFPAKL